MADLSFPSTETVLKTAKTYGRDLTERVLTTFLASFVAAIPVTAPLDGTLWKSAAAGGIGATVSLVKGLVARLRSVTNSASLAKGV